MIECAHGNEMNASSTLCCNMYVANVDGVDTGQALSGKIGV